MIGVCHVAVGVAALADTVHQMGHLRVERMMLHGARVRVDGGHGGPVRLCRQEALGPQSVVAQSAFGAQQVDVESIGHLAIEKHRGLSNSTVAELDHGHDVRVVLEQPLLVVRHGRHFGDLVVGEPSHGVHGMAAPQQHGAAASGLGMSPLPTAVPLADTVPVIHLDVKQVADRPGAEHRLEILEQRIPSQHEAHNAPDAGLSDCVAQRSVLGQ